jgi:hypothetical protein
LGSPPDDYPRISFGVDHDSSVTNGAAAVLSRSNFDNLISVEKAATIALMNQEALKMYSGILPSTRNYNFFRNLVELRDIPRGILQLQETMRNLRSLEASLKIPSKLVSKIRRFKTSLDDIPKEYLGYHFGWKQTYKDVSDLLKSPTKISRQINFLISRNGKDTTYRSNRNFESVTTGISGFDYDVLYGEYSPSTESRIQRSTELRMVVNANFTLPAVNTPAFIEHLWLDKLGIYPRVTDIYNLIPWTWLIDWFTGVGNYIEVIDNINHDSSLINWGFLTAKTKGKLVTDFRSKSDQTTRIFKDFDPGIVSTTTVINNHQSNLDYTFQLRKDIASLTLVHKTSDISSLTDYQKSILAAIIAQSGSGRFPGH